MNEKTCFIVGGGEMPPLCFSPGPEDLVIAADAGYAALKETGIRVDLVLGDFDSLPYIPVHPHVVRLKQEKDDTDMLAAIRYGLARGYRLFHIYGGTGGRLDHTLANIQCLAFLAHREARGFLFGKQETITAVTNGSIVFEAGLKGRISVFAHGDFARGVTLTGLKYPLTDAEVSSTFPIGVSNAFTGVKSEVSVQKGTLIVLTENPEQAREPQDTASHL